MTPTTTLLPVLGFIGLTVICVCIFILGMRKALLRTSLSVSEQKGYLLRVSMGIILWLSASTLLARTGFLSDFTSRPPRFVVVLLVPMALTVLLLVGRRTKEVLKQVPPAALIALQAFRIPVELLLWRLYAEDALPVQMTFEGLNWDVLTGLSAPLFAWLCFRGGKVRRTLVWVWNLGGLLLLINIVFIALTSTPTPIRLFMNEPANTIVTQVPFVWLPAFLVPLAYGLHFPSWKQLRLLKKAG